MDYASLFPDAYAEGAAERSATFWDTSWPLPVPRWEPSCVLCGERLILKDWRWHKRETGSRSPWRCDVRLKCVGCGWVPQCGVLVTEVEWRAAERARLVGRWVSWREGKGLLDDAGLFG